MSETPFKPFLSSEKNLPEMTVRAVILGIILSLFFALGNAFVGLKVGMTVSASIPASVISMGLLRLFFKRVSILENNLVQTIASAGEALAAGTIFTIPTLFFLGEPLSVLKTFTLSVLGGFLGVFFMLPLREHFIVKEHKTLLYPEGRACAEILKAGERGPGKALLALFGVFIGSLYRSCIGMFHLWPEVIGLKIKSFLKATVSLDTTPALLGVGFIIGPRVSGTMMGGAALAWWVFMPLLKIFGQGNMIIPPAQAAVHTLSDTEIWSEYIRYIGAGGVTIGGLFSLAHMIPGMAKLFHPVRLKTIFRKVGEGKKPPRTDTDLPLSLVLIGSLIIGIALWLIPTLHLNALSVFIIFVTGFFFVAVTSMTVGIVGSSSNPASGIIIMTLLITLLLFLSLDMTDRIYMIMATMVSSVVAIAICIAADTSQDLKTGYLIGATPKKQQIGMLIGTVAAACIMGGALILLNRVYKLGSSELSAPQATMLSLIVKGFEEGNLPFQLILVGLLTGLSVELMGVRALAFSLGLYLPLATTLSLFVGGLISYFVHRNVTDDGHAEKGILLASGLIAGDALTGIAIAVLSVAGLLNVAAPPLFGPVFGCVAYALLAFLLTFLSRRKKRHST